MTRLLHRIKMSSKSSKSGQAKRDAIQTQFWQIKALIHTSKGNGFVILYFYCKSVQLLLQTGIILNVEFIR